MKISCYCGAPISDATDHLPHKAHLIPDQSLFGVWDRIDEEVIDPVASGQLTVEDAYTVSRKIMSSVTRTIWQCFACGRLYLDGPDGKLCCFVPESDENAPYRSSHWGIAKLDHQR